MLSKIKQDTIQAMKDKAQLDLSVLRMLKSSIENAQIAKKDHSELSSAEVINIIRKQIAQRQDSADQFKAGGREDLANKELEEVDILQRYLPVEWTDEELDAFVTTVIADLGATTKKDMGRVIKTTVDLAKGQCDNRRISQLVGSKLS